MYSHSGYNELSCNYCARDSHKIWLSIADDSDCIVELKYALQVQFVDNKTSMRQTASLASVTLE